MDEEGGSVMRNSEEDIFILRRRQLLDEDEDNLNLSPEERRNKIFHKTLISICENDKKMEETERTTFGDKSELNTN